MTWPVPPCSWDKAERSAANFLRHIGVLNDGPLEAAETRMVEVPDLTSFTFAPAAGVFEPYDRLGDMVEGGAPAGALHFVESPGHEPAIVHYGRSGMMWCTRGAGRVETGDPVAIVASEWTDA